jgi:hypothetical protein
MKRSENKQHTGIALLFGVGSLGQHYGSRISTLQSPNGDIEDLKIIAKLNGLEVKEFLHANATRQNFQTHISKAARTLKTGDFFLLAFSGFGSCLPNYRGKWEDLPTKTWCLYDSQILLSEVKLALSTFQAGVNVLVISESSFFEKNSPETTELKASVRTLQKEISDTVYLAHKDFYDAAALANTSDIEIQANVIWLHACQPNQSAYENTFNGLLTSAIKRVWKGGLFTRPFQQFLEEVVGLLPPFQSPSLETLGGNPSELLSKRPFTI